MKIIKPMLAHAGSIEDLTREDCIFEPKMDGIRALCYIEKGTLRFVNRNMRDITHRYPECAFADRIRATTAVLDGEIVVYDEHGRPDFHLVQTRDRLTNRTLIEQRSKILQVTYVVFDIVMKDNVWLLDQPLFARKKILVSTVTTNRSQHLERIVYTDDGKKLWQVCIKNKLEGVVAKEKTSLYLPGVRTYSWIKIKEMNTIDCVIIGFTQTNRLISALLLALYDNGTWRYLNKVGTGFNEKEITQLYQLLSKKRRAASVCPTPFVTGVTWVKPEVACEIKYVEKTRGKKLRIPVFVRLREDKKPIECTPDQ